MLTLPIFTRPSYSLASSSRIGDTARQGLHHSAQKSTRTGREDLRTSCGKLVSVRVTMLGADIRNQEMRFGFIIAQSQADGGSWARPRQQAAELARGWSRAAKRHGAVKWAI